jgi:osmotically-inducible protein OsmY
MPHSNIKEDRSMTKTMRSTRAALVMATLAGALLSLPQVSLAARPGTPNPGAAAQAQQDNSPTSEAQARLNSKQYRDVKVAVDNGIATLTGTVDLFEYKADAEKRVHKAKGVVAVRNLVQVAGPAVLDQDLEAKLREKLAYDRVGYGNTFNAITVTVQSGVATVGGHARTDVDKDSALAVVSMYPGVKDVIGEIEVDPVSMMDDQTRMAVARAVYGYPSLTKYSMDPVKPIRISVQNGHVELYGTVDSQSDKETAYLRANGVPGTFSVKNSLEVANQPSESR